MTVEEEMELIRKRLDIVPPEVQAVADHCDRDASSGPSTFVRRVYVFESGDGHRWMADEEAVYTSLAEIPAPV